MTAVHFDLDTVRNDLNDIASKNPDYIYKQPSSVGCSYFDEGTPSCIVGHMFAKHGIADSQLPRSLNYRRIDLLPDSVPEVVSFDKLALAYVTEVQGNQDTGMPWGESVKVANDMFIGRES